MQKSQLKVIWFHITHNVTPNGNYYKNNNYKLDHHSFFSFLLLWLESDVVII